MSESSHIASRTLRSRVGAIAVVLVALVSVVSYIAISVTINGEPSTTPFQGFVALLQSTAASQQDQVTLIVDPQTPGGAGLHPSLSYVVAVCGSKPFQGVLLIGGDARLSHLRGSPALGTSNANGQSSSKNLPDLKFLVEGPRTNLDLGPVQTVHLTISQPPRCKYAYARNHAPPSPLLGQAQVIMGQAAAPVQRQWRLGWWSGPRTSQSWPLIGSLPGVPFNELGVFHAVAGLTGAWLRPERPYFVVNVGSLTARAILEQARPQTSKASELDWEGTQPVQPVAVYTDTISMGTLQNWLVAAGIFLGIGGSLLASLLYDWARLKRPPDPPRGPSRKHPNNRATPKR
jgi:hypothetical protein